jgi:biopolymer transport protein TolR
MPTLVNRGRGRRTINEINMVPFIDVMLVLLIIFMVTAPLITPSVINLPKVGKAAKQPDVVVQVVVTGGTRCEAANPVLAPKLELKFKDKTSRPSLKELSSAVLKAQAGAANAAVVISADGTVMYESVVKVMDTLQRAGVQRVGLSVQVVN